ncbi:MAG: type II methionyl aminopeptidase [archaeon]|nr:type II methionyl aminopeptidase [archaeon]
MDDIEFESYLKAGKAVAKALDLAKKITRPGTKYIDLASICEGEIINSGCELSFPINISLDEIAAHYSPIIDDQTKVPEKGLIKIDCGSHYNGFIADAAITINLNNEKGIYQDLKDAADAGLQAAIQNFKPGVDLVTIGSFIHQAIGKYNVKPISNLGGHSLDQYNLHAGSFVPNTPSAGTHYKIKVDDVFAIEPFSTNGAGRIKNHPDKTIYRVINAKKKNLKINDKAIAQKFKKKFKTLPFSPRAIDFIDKNKAQNVVDKFLKFGILDGYNIFIEIANGLVAQKEHTVIVTEEGAHITTVLENEL